MGAKLKFATARAKLRRSREWGRGVSSVPSTAAAQSPIVSPEIASPRTSAKRGAGRQGFPERWRHSPVATDVPRAQARERHQLVLRDRAKITLWARNRRRAMSAASVVAVVAGTLLLATPALALTVTTSLPTRSGTAATLNGVVDPQGVELKSGAAGCRIEWGKTEAYGEVAPCNFLTEVNGADFTPKGIVPTGLESGDAVAEITGLELGHTYHYRLAAANATEAKTGADQSFIAGFGHAFSTSFSGSGPTTLTNPTAVAVDESSGDVYVTNSPVNELQTLTVGATATGDLTKASTEVTGLHLSAGELAEGASIEGEGIPLHTTVLAVNETEHKLTLSKPATTTATTVPLAVTPNGGTFTLTFKGQTTNPIHFPASSVVVQNELEALSTLGPKSVSITEPGQNSRGPYAVEFVGKLAGSSQPSIAVDPSALTAGPHTAQVAVARPGSSTADVEKFSPTGEFLLMIGREVNRKAVESHGTEAEQDVCAAEPGEAEPGEDCQPGAPTTAPGGFTDPALLAVDNSALDHSTGDLYVGDRLTGAGSGDIQKFGPEGHLITTWGDSGLLDGSTDPEGGFATPGTDEGLSGLAVDPSGRLFATAEKRYSEFDPSGAFLAGTPFPTGIASLAVDSSGHLYLSETREGGALGKWSAQGTRIGTLVNNFAGTPTSLAIDPVTRDLFALYGDRVKRFAGSCDNFQAPCTPLETFGEGQLSGPGNLALDASSGAVYVADTGNHRVAAFTAAPYLPRAAAAAAPKASTAETLTGNADPAGAPPIEACAFQYAPVSAFNEVQNLTLHGATGGTFSLLTYSSEDRRFEQEHEDTTLALPYNAPAQHVAAANESTANIGKGNLSVTGPPGGPFRIEFVGRFAHHRNALLVVNSSSNLTPPTATTEVLRQTEGDAAWGTAPTSACEPLPSPQFSTATPVTAQATGLQPGTAYFFRLLAEDKNGPAQSYEENEFTTLPLAPTVGATSASAVHADTAQIATEIDPGGGEAAYHTHYYLEYVTQKHFEEEEFTGAARSPELDAGGAHTPQSLTVSLSALDQNTTYHYRAIASNECELEKQCLVPGAAHTFTTLPSPEQIHDTCPNAHVRQQTGSALLLDCRAYELVSAANAGGYDVESTLIEGQSPFAGYPQASGRVLYGVHGGGIPGTDHPTDRGVDPYLATRTENGWSTEYVGIPSNATPSTAPFASTLLEADQGLGAFSFGGPEICQPCFADGSTGIPLRNSDGNLVQGMAGSEDPGPSAEPAGFIAKHFSADGTHFLFGSTAKFETDGNEGQISIYDRNLATGVTHVVSKAPGGGSLPCEINCQSNGIGVLDVSADGSHILLGQLVSVKEGIKRWRLYMNVGDSGETTALTPGATEGVLFDGMTADGSKVFFSSPQHLTNEDTSHTGPAIFLWQEGHLLALITKGNSGSCDPLANSAHEHWNVSGSEKTCGALAIGGGGGVSSATGAVYFLSPELLAGTEEPKDGVLNAPNLYRAGPEDGYATHFVATLESALNGPQPPRSGRSFLREFGFFTKATGLAVDRASGDVYVLDLGGGENELPAGVAKFDSSGNLIQGWGSHGHLSGSSATGTGELTAGSNTITKVTTASGAFSPGQEISAPGIPPETTIAACSPSCEAPTSLEISQEATASGPAQLSAKQPFSELPSSGSPTQLAVDQSSGDLYVPDLLHFAVDVFDSSGNYLTQIGGIFGPTALAVDPSNGDLYVATIFGGIDVFEPSAGSPPTFTPNPELSIPAAHSTTGLAVAPNGTVYVANGSETAVYKKGPTAYEKVSTLDPEPSQGVAIDPTTGYVSVDEGNRVVQFDSSGHQLATFSSEAFSGSVGLALDPGGDLYATTAGGAKLAAFGRFGLPPGPAIDNPAVIDSVTEPEARHTADFQLTPSGEFAAFPSSLALAGAEEEPAGHDVLYRYDAAAKKLTCVSCTPTGAPSTGDSNLAPDGLSLTEDGRVFFDSTDRLAAADTDNRRDAYEWEAAGTGNCTAQSPSFSVRTGACLALISAGTSTFDSGLLGVSADGTDAYFFTRDSLVPQDKNGPTMKIYDAREGGGFPYLPPREDCKASDECHGAASPLPPPIEAGSEAGSPHNAEEEPKPCKKSFVKKHGKCVQRHPHKHRHHVRHERSKKHRAKHHRKGSVHS